MRDKDAEKIAATLARLLREKRLEEGLSHQTLADLSGVSRSMISRMESGERSPTVIFCLKLAKALRIPLSDMLRKAGS
ncbi:MAG: helix-turn-helix transcriptional regulator [Alphaproteobacteria bacterium]